MRKLQKCNNNNNNSVHMQSCLFNCPPITGLYTHAHHMLYSGLLPTTCSTCGALVASFISFQGHHLIGVVHFLVLLCAMGKASPHLQSGRMHGFLVIARATSPLTMYSSSYTGLGRGKPGLYSKNMTHTIYVKIKRLQCSI